MTRDEDNTRMKKRTTVGKEGEERASRPPRGDEKTIRDEILYFSKREEHLPFRREDIYSQRHG